MPEELDPRRLIGDVTDGLVKALRTAWEACEALNPRPTLAGVNLPEILAEALRELATELGSTEALVAHRAGSWEADHVRQLGFTWE